jgi:hypothetical protein
VASHRFQPMALYSLRRAVRQKISIQSGVALAGSGVER